MAKQKPQAEKANPWGGAEAKPKRFMVTLCAATPLRSPQLEVEADNSAEAWAKFCEHNGISDSTCAKTIEPIE